MYSIELKEKSFQVELDTNHSHQGMIDGKAFKLDLRKTNNEYHILYHNNSYTVELESFEKETKQLVLKINNDRVTCQVSDELDLLLKQLGMDVSVKQKMNNVKAPMPGLVIDILVDVGQVVKQGDTLLILEAMKMENNIKASADGKVKQIVCETSKAVEKNDILVVFE